MEIAEATLDQVPVILKIMEEARMFQRSMGFRQWDDNYPPASTIENDIALRQGFVFIIDGKVAAYACIAMGDPEYERMSHIWQHKLPKYAALHRIAIADEFQGKGLGAEMFSLMEQNVKDRGVNLVRLETGVPNKVMQRILTKREYTNLGVHVFSWGERVAFEKLLN